MKHAFKLKSLALSMAIAGSSVAALAPATTQAGVSGNVGVVSQYIFRGVPQSQGAAAQAGIDYGHESGAYVGLWGSQVGGIDSNGDDSRELEYDVYGGYETEMSGVTLGAGFTFYRYTQEVFDSKYDEVNLWAGYGPLSVSYNVGTHGGDAYDDGKDVDYSVITVSAEYAGMYALYGMGDDFMGKDTDHSWIELGYGTEIAEGTDVSFSLINTSKEGAGYTKDGKDSANTMMVVGITKSFDIM
jgi:uncharacterized protein (TIGR02001 family)